MLGTHYPIEHNTNGQSSATGHNQWGGCAEWSPRSTIIMSGLSGVIMNIRCRREELNAWQATRTTNSPGYGLPQGGMATRGMGQSVHGVAGKVRHTGTTMWGIQGYTVGNAYNVPTTHRLPPISPLVHRSQCVRINGRQYTGWVRV